MLYTELNRNSLFRKQCKVHLNTEKTECMPARMVPREVLMLGEILLASHNLSIQKSNGTATLI